MADLLSSGNDRPPRRRLGIVVVIVLLAGAGIYLGLRDDSSNSAERPDSPATPTVSGTAPAESMSVNSLGHPLLGITGKWELFGRNDDSLVRVQPARGRILTTRIPRLDSSGPVSFVVGKNRAIIRPLDRVAGLAVPDDEYAQVLVGAMAQNGPFLPGPKPDTVWIPNDDSGHISMRLVTAKGRSAHEVVRFPQQVNGFAGPDGAGYLLIDTGHGVYDARPDGMHRITKKAVLAAGPTGWLTVECGRPDDCNLTAIDRKSGNHRNLGPFSGSVVSGNGTISPNGANAALIRTGAGDPASLHLISMRTGVDQQISVPLDPATLDYGTAVWSPDSRWLFVAGGAGKVFAVDGRSGSVHDLDGIPPVTQLAIRPTAGA